MFAPYDFDASVWEMLMALGSGAGLVVLHPRATAPAALAARMSDTGVTAATLPPVFLRTLGGTELSTVRLLVSAGEACTPDLDRLWSAGRTFINAYGPTETTVCATMARCDGRHAVVPLGRPLGNLRAYVLDEHLNPMPPGVPGELCVAGVGLARGYRGAPARTAEAFVPDPFGPPGSRLYRTGDLVRRGADGQLFYAGRVDHQVKIRGFRIETGEVESVLARHPDVREAVVLVEQDPGQEPHLVAAVVLGAEAQAVVYRGEGQQRWQGRSLQRELNEFVAGALPSYMIPSSYAAIPSVPLTLHGKVDRDAIRELARTVVEPAVEDDADQEPLSDNEKAISEIWARNLGLQRVDRHDHFLEVGGHSLVAVQVIDEVRRHFRIELPVNVLFSSPVLADFALAVEAMLPAA
jgi:acyl-coenzyme A synthetase/AMP-(fatty) acid ligase